MKGRVSKFSPKQVEQIVDAVEKYGASDAPKHLTFHIVPQLCNYYWRKANPDAPKTKRGPRKPKPVLVTE